MGQDKCVELLGAELHGNGGGIGLHCWGRVNTRMALPLGMILAIITQLFLFTELYPFRKLATTSSDNCH